MPQENTLKQTNLFERVIGREDKIQFRHGVALGATHSGKTVFSMYYLQLHFLKGYCCIYVDMGRSDGFTLVLPETDAILSKKIQYIADKNVKPRGFPVRVHLPAIRKEPGVKAITGNYPEFFELFRIPMSDLRADDIIMLLDKASPGAEAFLRLLMKKRKFKSVDDLLRLLAQLQSKKKTLVVGGGEIKAGAAMNSLIRAISDLQEYGLVCSDSSENKLNLEEIIDDTEHIHVLSLYDIDDYRLRYLVGAYFFRRLYEFKRKHPTKSKVFLYLDEATLWCPSSPKLAPLSWKEHGTMETIANIARQGRAAGIKLWFAIQRWMELHPSIRANVDQVFIFRSNEDELKRIFESVGRLPGAYYFNILDSLPKAQPGVGLRLWRNANDFRYPCFAVPSMAHSLKSLEDPFQLLRDWDIPFRDWNIPIKDEFEIEVVEVEPKKKRENLQPLKSKARKMKNQGSTYREIAEVIGRSDRTIKQWLLGK